MSDPPSIDYNRLGALTSQMITELRVREVATGIAVGEPAPRFVVPDVSGGKIALDARLEQGPVVLSFYRGAWCPVCHTELRAQQQALPDIRALGASMLAVSPQPPEPGADLVAALNLGFDVLSDLDQAVIRDYRLQFLPVPATLVIDRAGIVRARPVDANYQ